MAIDSEYVQVSGFRGESTVYEFALTRVGVVGESSDQIEADVEMLRQGDSAYVDDWELSLLVDGSEQDTVEMDAGNDDFWTDVTLEGGGGAPSGAPITIDIHSDVWEADGATGELNAEVPEYVDRELVNVVGCTPPTTAVRGERAVVDVTVENENQVSADVELVPRLDKRAVGTASVTIPSGSTVDYEIELETSDLGLGEKQMDVVVMPRDT